MCALLTSSQGNCTSNLHFPEFTRHIHGMFLEPISTSQELFKELPRHVPENYLVLFLDLLVSSNSSSSSSSSGSYSCLNTVLLQASNESVLELFELVSRSRNIQIFLVEKVAQCSKCQFINYIYLKVVHVCSSDVFICLVGHWKESHRMDVCGISH